jgi:hypothetical protein
MKKMPVMKNVFILTSLLMLGLMCPVRAQQSPTNQLLTGHARTVDDVAKLSSVIAIGNFKKFEGATLDGPDAISYQAQIEIVRCLKGSLKGQLQVNLDVVNIPAYGVEALPEIGVNYILFIHVAPGFGGKIYKILPSAKENISRIEALVTKNSKD